VSPGEGPRTSGSVVRQVESRGGSAGSRLDEGQPRRHFTDEEERAAMTVVRSTNRESLTERVRARAHAGLVREERDGRRDDDDSAGTLSARVAGSHEHSHALSRSRRWSGSAEAAAAAVAASSSSFRAECRAQSRRTPKTSTDSTAPSARRQHQEAPSAPLALRIRSREGRGSSSLSLAT